MSVREVFDPCRNLHASQTILLDNYQRALAQGHAWGQPALQAALSAYNTGSMSRGSVYVRRVLDAAGSTLPVAAVPEAMSRVAPASAIASRRDRTSRQAL